jgi:hypothetical protein
MPSSLGRRVKCHTRVSLSLRRLPAVPGVAAAAQDGSSPTQVLAHSPHPHFCARATHPAAAQTPSAHQAAHPPNAHTPSGHSRADLGWLLSGCVAECSYLVCRQRGDGFERECLVSASHRRVACSGSGVAAFGGTSLSGRSCSPSAWAWEAESGSGSGTARAYRFSGES